MKKVMKGTSTTDQYLDLLYREAQGEFGEEGLGPYFQWLGDNWKTVCDLRQGQSKIVKVALLESLGSISIPTLTQFVARDHFKVDTSDIAAVKVSYLGDNLKAWFGGKTEETKSGASSLRYHTLLRDSVDAPIVAELGGEAKAETSLAEIWLLMELQKNSEAGALLNNGCANIFYVRDVSGVLRAVRVSWLGDGWYVRAHSVEGPRRCYSGYRVFSR